MNSNDVLKLLIQIGNTSSRNGKEDLLRLHIEQPIVQKVVRFAYDPFITFGLTPPEPPTKAGTDSFDAHDRQPWTLLDQLAKREVTGLAAKAAVEMEMGLLDAESAALLWRILRKDLRCGITEKTINTVLPSTVPTFDVMLSKPFEDKRIKVWPVAGEPKLDGLRGMCIVKDGTGKFFSRVGNHFPALDHLGPLMVQIVTDAWQVARRDASVSKISEAYYKFLGGDAGPSCAIDSEIMTGSFNKTSGDVKRKGKEAEDAIVYVFDAVPAKSMLATDTPEIKIPFKLRRVFARWLVGHARAGAPIRMTEMEMCHSIEEVYALYERHRSTTIASYIANGDKELEARLLTIIIDKKTGLPAVLEGAMFKPLDGPYVKKKGFLWMKMKPEETADLRIKGWFEGKAGTKLEGKFGGFIVDHEGVDVRVGGGFSDAQREEFLKLAKLDDADEAALAQHSEHLTGALGRVMQRLIEVEYHEVTPDGSLRHPRFVRFRDDKDEKLKVAA